MQRNDTGAGAQDAPEGDDVARANPSVDPAAVAGLPGMAALWQADDARRRPGRRPGLTVAGLVEAAVALADADGLAAVSMARVAERLGVTTMALYRYVTGKDELLALMYDAALPAPADPPDRDASAAGPPPWRPQLERWCSQQLDLVRLHPWIVELASQRALGPNRVAWIERGLTALAGTPLPVPLRVAVIGMLSLHVLTEGQLIAAATAQQGGRAADAEHPALIDYGAMLRAVVDPGTYPLVAEGLAAGAFDEEPSDEAQTFDEHLALQVLLDGIQALITRVDAGDGAGGA